MHRHFDAHFETNSDCLLHEASQTAINFTGEFKYCKNMLQYSGHVLLPDSTVLSPCIRPWRGKESESV
jgi:hypothetical protein